MRDAQACRCALPQRDTIDAAVGLTRMREGVNALSLIAEAAQHGIGHRQPSRCGGAAALASFSILIFRRSRDPVPTWAPAFAGVNGVVVGGNLLLVDTIIGGLR